jgi:iron complex transport system substrate-binding protein
MARLATALVRLAGAAVFAASPALADTTLRDAGGRSVRIGGTSRIVSIGGDVTEILYALGAGGRIVAVDSTSQFPPEALREKKSVGYMRALSSEGVLSVNPSLILASESAGPPEVVGTLKAARVPYVEVPDRHSPKGVAGKVRLIAKAIGAEAAGDRIAAQIDAEFAALARDRARIKKPLRAMFVLSVQNGRAIVGGKTTSADAILALAGAENAAASVTGFKPLPDEAIVALAPEVIVAMRRAGDNGATHDAAQAFALKGVQATPAGASKRLVMMDGLYLLGFGPRAPAAARDLMRALYPDDAAGAAR